MTQRFLVMLRGLGPFDLVEMHNINDKLRNIS